MEASPIDVHQHAGHGLGEIARDLNPPRRLPRASHDVVLPQHRGLALDLDLRAPDTTMMNYRREIAMKVLLVFNHEPYDGTDVTWNRSWLTAASPRRQP